MRAALLGLAVGLSLLLLALPGDCVAKPPPLDSVPAQVRVSIGGAGVLSGTYICNLHPGHQDYSYLWGGVSGGRSVAVTCGVGADGIAYIRVSAGYPAPPLQWHGTANRDGNSWDVICVGTGVPPIGLAQVQAN